MLCCCSRCSCSGCTSRDSPGRSRALVQWTPSTFFLVDVFTMSQKWFRRDPNASPKGLAKFRCVQNIGKSLQPGNRRGRCCHWARNLLGNPVEPDLALHRSLPDLLRNLLWNPFGRDLALHQCLPCRPSPEPSEPSLEPCWTWAGACTSAHRSYSGLKTPLAYAVGEWNVESGI